MKIRVYVWNPDGKKVQFDPYKSFLTQRIVNARIVKSMGDKTLVSYTHPRLKKVVTTLI